MPANPLLHPDMPIHEMEFIYKGRVSLPGGLSASMLGPTIISPSGLSLFPSLLSPPVSITSVPAVYPMKKRNY